METQWLAKLRRIFRYRIAFGRIIPPNARANPAQFSEAEFPIVCPKCDYLLHGLTIPRCPECGRDFDRGRLLVEQYVIEGGLRTRGKGRKFVKWCEYFILIVYFAVFGLQFLLFLLPPGVLMAQLETIMQFYKLLMICIMVTFPVWIAVMIRRMILRFRNRKKARRVFESCKHDAPVDLLDR